MRGAEQNKSWYWIHFSVETWKMQSVNMCKRVDSYELGGTVSAIWHQMNTEIRVLLQNSLDILNAFERLRNLWVCKGRSM